MSLDDNQKRVLAVYRAVHRASKADVARAVGLTHPAVAQIINRLCELGYLTEEEEKRKGRRGQPASIYTLSDHNIFLGIHVGRRRIDFVALDLAGRRIASWSDATGFLQRDKLRRMARDQLNAFLAREEVASRSLMGIGISTPYFWEGWRTVLNDQDEADKTWDSDMVVSLFDIPEGIEVFVENDGSAAALGELTFGSGAAHQDFLYVNIGTFIGGGLIIDGTLRTGAHGNSAALGPFPVGPSRLAGAPKSPRPFDELLRRSSVNSLQEHARRQGRDLDLAQLDRLSDPADIACVTEWVEDCAQALATFFIGVWSLIDIEAIILSGPLPPTIMAQVIATAEREVKAYAIEGVIPCDIKLGTLGRDAHCVGAACLPVLRDLGPPMVRHRVEAALDLDS